jgi:hypothetical protein
MQVYKVVHREPDGRLTSMATTGDLEVEYQPGHWVEAPVGGLLAFDDYEAAQRFWTAGQIWLADAEEHVTLPPRGLACPTESRAQLLWEGRTPGALVWPYGTVAYRRLRLIRRVA